MKNKLLLLCAIVILTVATTTTACTANVDVPEITLPDNGEPEHVHEFVGEIILPTCTESGYTIFTCECGNTYNDNYVEALGHVTIIHNKQAPTCIEKGWDTYETCTKCDYTTYVELGLIEHTPGNWIIDKEASYTEDGSKHKECTVCNKTVETSIIPMFTHSYTSVITAPTCLEKGYTTHTCSDCQNTYVDDYTSALGHSWAEDWIILEEATCAVDGIKRRDCLRCDYYETQTIPMEKHSFNMNEWLFDETYHWHGAVCGHNDQKANKTIHNWSDGKCIVCGYMIKLEAPVITKIEYDIVYWTAVENATSYTVTVDYDFSFVTAGLSINLSEVPYTRGAKTVPITVTANGGEKYADSNKSIAYEYFYVPEKKNLTPDEENLYNFPIGYGYNIIENEPIHPEKVERFEVLNINKLLTLAKYYHPEIATGETISYHYSSVEQHMANLDILMKTNFGLDVANIGKVQQQLSLNAGLKRSQYKYNDTYIIQTYIHKDAHTFIEYDYEDLKYCLSQNFLEDIKKYNPADEDAWLEYMYDRYGTHVILGIITGGTYTAEYVVSTNKEDIATKVKLSFANGGGISLDQLLKLDFGLNAETEGEFNWSGEDTEGYLRVYWEGSNEGAAYRLEDISKGLENFQSNVQNRVVKFTDDGAVSISYLISLIDSSLGDKFNEYVNEQGEKEYQRVYNEYTQPSTLPMTVTNENGKNVLRIDLSAYQFTGSLGNAYNSNLFNNVLTVYPKMMGKRIDKIVISGAFNHPDKKLINSFSIKLSDKWNKDVEIVVDNLGVICASSQGLIDSTGVSSNYKVDIKYTGNCAIKTMDNVVHIYEKGIYTGPFHTSYYVAFAVTDPGNLRNKMIKSSDHHTDEIDTGFSVDDLLKVGFTQVQIKIDFDARKVLSGTERQVWIRNQADTELWYNNVYHTEGDGSGWPTLTRTATINLVDIRDGKFKIEWGAGVGCQWELGWTRITVTVQ